MSVERISWLDRPLVEQILRSGENDPSIEVIDIKKEAATNKGDNYVSEVFRVFVEYSYNQNEDKIRAKKSIIVKIAPLEDGPIRDLVSF